MVAAAYGHLPVVRFLLEKGAEVNLKRRMVGTTALMEACHWRQIQIIDYLLAHGASVDDTTYEGQDVMEYALGKESVSISVRPALKDREFGESTTQMISILLEHGVRPSRRALGLAVAQGEYDIVQAFAANGADLVNRSSEDDLVSTALISLQPNYSAYASPRQFDLIDYLIQRDSLFPQAHIQRPGLLIQAGFTGNSALVKTFINVFHFDPTYEAASGENVLHAAARAGNLMLVQYLVEDMGLDPSIRSRSCGNALHWSAVSDSLNVVRYLIEKCGLDVNAYGTDSTPLSLAADNCNYDMVRYLVERGALVNKPDSAGPSVGWTPLDHAEGRDSVRSDPVVRYLIEHGAVGHNVIR